MPLSLTCPFCRATFTLPDTPPARRTPCPQCGESVPVTDAAAVSPAVAPAAPRVPAKSSNLVFVSLMLTALIVAGFLAWYFLTPKSPPPTPPSPPSPPATLPPRALAGLKFIPKDSQIVAAIQPAALGLYADRNGQTADALLGGLGVPADLLNQLRVAGVPPEAIQSVVVAANVDTLRLVLVLTLREPLRDEARFREALKAQGQPTRVEVGGLPLVMAVPNDRTYLFAWNEADLAAAKAPTAGYDDLRAAVRESVDRVSPAAFAWVATDSHDWAGLPLVKLSADRIIPSEAVGKLAGVRAVAAGVSLESGDDEKGPELQLRLGVRANDSTVAREWAGGMKAKLADLNATTTPKGEWAEAVVPLDPPARTLPKLRDALRR